MTENLRKDMKSEFSKKSEQVIQINHQIGLMRGKIGEVNNKISKVCSNV